MARQINKDADIQCVDYRYDDGIRGRVDYDCCSTITTKESGYSGMPLIKMGGGL